MKVLLYTDGASRGNPGHSSGGVLIVDEAGKTLFEGGFYFGQGTNNEAEYKAFLAGLDKARSLGAGEVACHMDSELVMKQLSGLYKLKADHLRGLHGRAREGLASFRASSLAHLPREHPRMKIADRLANKALDEAARKRSKS